MTLCAIWKNNQILNLLIAMATLWKIGLLLIPTSGRNGLLFLFLGNKAKAFLSFFNPSTVNRIKFYFS